MISLTLSQAAKKLGGKLVGDDVSFSSVGTDSRAVKKGDLFVALKGPNFDGHDYIKQVAKAGAVAAMVQRDITTPIPSLVVEDSCVALGRLANVWRGFARGQLAAITGSNGKTTVKEMLASIMRQCGSTLSTEGNLNNHIGLPLTLLRLQEEEYVVVEMGASAPHEIEYLSNIARPDVAVVTNVGHAHLEGFGSLEGVARAKGEIVTGLAKGGTFVFNADDPWVDLWRELAGRRATVEFGLQQKADIFSPAEEGETGWGSDGLFNRFPVQTPDGEIEIELQLAGQHNRYNALAAVAAARLMGASVDQIKSGLAEVQPVAGRLQVVAAKGGVQLIDDSYNANPDSVAAAISLLASAPGRRFLVLGELAEMGAGGDRFYRQLGAVARMAGIEFLYGIGPAAQAAVEFGQGGRQFKSKKKLLESLKRDTEEGDRILVKGSRRAEMELVVQAMAAEGRG